MAYMVKRQVREINRRLFANDICYTDDENGTTFKSILSGIIQTYNPEDMISNTPIILDIKDSNITEETLDKIKLLSKQSVYLQFNNRVLVDTQKLNIIRSLKEIGYKVIIEINPEDQMFRLANLIANIIRVNIKAVPNSFSHGTDLIQCKVLAYNVDTPEDYIVAESVGISLYEGEYLSEGINMTVPEVTHSNVGFLELLCLISNKVVDVQETVRLISQDALLSSQVIRLANSKYFKSSRIGNVGEAVVRIGLQNLKRWLLLLEFGRNDNPKEDILKSSYYKAILCEKIAIEQKGAFIKPHEAYLVGLLSQLDILTGRPIALELSSLSLTSMIEDSLIYRDNAGGAMINLINALEESNTVRVDRYCKALNVSPDKVNSIYCKAVIEARSVWKSITEFGGIYL